MPAVYLISTSAIGEGDDRFFNSWGKLLTAAKTHGIDLQAAGQTENETSITIEFRDDLGRAKLVICDDYIAKFRYIEIAAENPQKVETLRQLAVAHLSIIPFPELLRRFDESVETEPAIVAKLAFGAPPGSEPDVIARLTRALGSTDERIRQFAAYGAGTLRWPELAAPLQEALCREPPGQVKSYLAN